MALLNPESQVVKDFGSNEGIAFQAQVAQDLLENKGILVGFIRNKDVIEDFLTKACQEFQGIGISDSTLEKLKLGKVWTLGDREKRIILDMVLESIGAGEYKQSNSEVRKKQYTLLEAYKVESSISYLYEDSKIQLIGNVIQIFSSSEILKVFLSDKEALGISRRNLEIKGAEKPSVLTLNLVREQSSPNGDVRKHEMWHAFDAVRFSILGITDNPFNRSKDYVANSKLIYDKYFDLLKEKSPEFLDYVFGKDRKIPSFWDFDDNLKSLHFELPAFLAGNIKSNGKIEFEEDNILDILIGSYILENPIKLDVLRGICNKNEAGRLVISTKLVLGRINSKSDDVRHAYLNEEPFVKYFTEIDKLDPEKKRKFKQGKEEELIRYYQEVVDFMYNDQNSPIVQIRKELQRAIDAFMLRNRKVGPYRALVEMSILPFNRWAAYVRLKESEESKDLPQ